MKIKIRAPFSTGPFIACIISGALLALAFPHARLWPLIFIGLTPLAVVSHGLTPRQSFWAGFLTGLVQQAGMLYWIVFVLTYFGGLPWFAAYPVFLLMIGYLALYPALFIFGLRLAEERLSVKYGGLVWMILGAALFTGLEYFRGFFLTGFPWEPLGASLTAYLPMVQAADLIGGGGLTFIIVLISLGLASAWVKKREAGWAAARTPLAVSIILLAALAVYGFIRIGQVETAMEGSVYRKVAVAQGNIEQQVKWDPEQRVITLNVYRDLTIQAAKAKPWLTVWPETAAPFFYSMDKSATNWISRLIRTTRRPLLFGAPAFEHYAVETRHYNRTWLVDEKGVARGYYDKVHLVPYGEYVPLKKYMPFIKKLTQASGTYYPGKKGKILKLDETGLGVLICYESIFAGLARQMVRQGAEYLVVMTNDAWFGNSSAPPQHYEQAVLRAVESRRAVIRAANTGISGLILPTGETIVSLGMEKRNVITGKLPEMNRTTLYITLGDALPMLSLGVTVVAFLAAWIRRKHAYHRP